MPEPLDNPQQAEIAFPHPAKGKNRRNEKEKTEGLNPALQPLQLSEKTRCFISKCESGWDIPQYLMACTANPALGLRSLLLLFNILVISNNYHIAPITNVIN